jgi:hypothetical protein
MISPRAPRSAGEAPALPGKGTEKSKRKIVSARRQNRRPRRACSPEKEKARNVVEGYALSCPNYLGVRRKGDDLGEGAEIGRRGACAPMTR